MDERSDRVKRLVESLTREEKLGWSAAARIPTAPRRGLCRASSDSESPSIDRSMARSARNVRETIDLEIEAETGS